MEISQQSKAQMACNYSAGYALLDKSKGDFGNRFECYRKQYGNALKGSIGDTLIIGGTVAAGAAVAKNAKVTNTIANVIKKGAVGAIKGLQKCKLSEKIVTPITNGLKKIVTSKNKTVALVAVAALGLSSLINNAKLTTYKAGKIDERYDNRAKMQKAFDK